MRIAALLAVLLGALPSTATAQERMAPVNPQIDSEEARVLAIEDEYVAAEVARDEPTLRRIVDESFRFNSDRGITTGKEELIQGVLKMSMVGQTVTERSVLLEGELALVFGTSEIVIAKPGQQHSTSLLRYTATYVNREGQWRMLALQMQKRASK
ncbi:MAG: nuclear transport factor 2 family protein [Proteobacteria bacterium]|nr:nuclear transport factor 2 family protein [Pseudomonadota bacterium]